MYVHAYIRGGYCREKYCFMHINVIIHILMHIHWEKTYLIVSKSFFFSLYFCFLIFWQEYYSSWCMGFWSSYLNTNLSCINMHHVHAQPVWLIHTAYMYLNMTWKSFGVGHACSHGLATLLLDKHSSNKLCSGDLNTHTHTHTQTPPSKEKKRMNWTLGLFFWLYVPFVSSYCCLLGLVVLWLCVMFCMFDILFPFLLLFAGYNTSWAWFYLVQDTYILLSLTLTWTECAKHDHVLLTQEWSDMFTLTMMNYRKMFSVTTGYQTESIL